MECNRKSVLAAFAVTVASTFTLVGCGDGGNQTLGSDARAPARTSDQVAKAPRSRIPVISPRPDYRIPVFAAIKALTSGSNEILVGGGPRTWGSFNNGFITATKPALAEGGHPAEFSRVSSEQRGTTYSVSSTTTTLDETDDTGRISLDLSVSTDGRSIFTFNGSGSITTPNGRYALSAPQLSISGLTVPYAIQYDVPALPGAGVEIRFGNIAARSFRLCLVTSGFPAPWQSREICWWHSKTDGMLHFVDLAGSSNARPFPDRTWLSSPKSLNFTRAVLSCVVQERGFRSDILGGESFVRNRRHFAIARFETSFANGGLYMPPPPLGSLRESFRITPAGKVYAIGDSTRSRTWVVRDNNVVRYTDAPLSVVDTESKSTICVALT